MVKLTFNSSNKKDTGGDFPALKLIHGEKARILCIEPEPEVGFIHNLRAPAVLADGTPVMEKVKTKGGGMVDRQKMDFIGRHLCFGNIETLLEPAGRDPQNCITCAKSVEHADMIDPPQRKFAMHVVKYKVIPGSFNVQTPFQAELLVWAFTDKRFGQISDIAEEHGDLRSRDLMLGPCENADYQNYDIAVAGKAVWAETPEYTEFVKVLYASNKIPDLTVAIGRKVEPTMAAEDIQKVIMRYQMVRGTAMLADAAPAGAAAGAIGGGMSAGTDLDALLGGGVGATATPATAPSMNFAPESVEAPGVVSEAPAAAEEEAPQEAPKVLNFDALLSGL